MPNQMSVIVCNYFKSVGKSMCAHYAPYPPMHRFSQEKERFLLFCFSVSYYGPYVDSTQLFVV